MPFEWLNDFQRSMEKPDNYADKTLAAYRLGIKAGGSIRGVSVCVAENCCADAKLLPEGTVYLPDAAPRLPLPTCSQGRKCPCVYRPVMTYEEGAE
jgi:hypothetical protein